MIKIVQFKSHVHLVDNGVLVDKLGKHVHDCTDESSGVTEANMNVIARDHLLVAVDAHVESYEVAIFIDFPHEMVILSLVAGFEVVLVRMGSGGLANVDIVSQNLLLLLVDERLEIMDVVLLDVDGVLLIHMSSLGAVKGVDSSQGTE